MDYNIYIHDSSSSSNQNGSQTVPWGQLQGQNPTKAWESVDEVNAAQELGGQLSNMSIGNLLSVGKGAFSKAIPAVASAFIINKIIQEAIKKTAQVIDTVLPFYETDSGNYYISMQWENIKNINRAITDPFQTVHTIARTEQMTRVNNQRRSMSRQLLGDSVANTYSNRGI